MKKIYSKPTAEIVEFNVSESIMDDFNLDGDNGNVSGGYDDDFWG